tara:strand:- start:265 stop:501 length:237 start_codon:yes stop_codon:yes gene_type:complete
MKNNNLEIKKGDLVNIHKFYLEEKNCIILDVIKDNYFKKGLLVYLYDNVKKTLDLDKNLNLKIESADRKIIYQCQNIV